jgi:hypothetical protein
MELGDGAHRSGVTKVLIDIISMKKRKKKEKKKVIRIAAE